MFRVLASSDTPDSQCIPVQLVEGWTNNLHHVHLLRKTGSLQGPGLIHLRRWHIKLCTRQVIKFKSKSNGQVVSGNILKASRLLFESIIYPTSITGSTVLQLPFTAALTDAHAKPYCWLSLSDHQRGSLGQLIDAPHNQMPHRSAL